MSKKANTNLAGKVMTDAGLSAEEIRRTTEITEIDAAAAKLYKGKLGNSTESAVHRLTWRNALLSEFSAIEPEQDALFEAVMRNSLAGLRANRDAGNQYDPNGKVSEKSIADLGKAGWWGVRVPKEYGGTDAATVNVMRGITQMSAAGFQNEAGLQSVHGCIGVIGPLKIFGSPMIKERLRDLATGTRMSAFALTEPGAGSDLSAVRTIARRVGDKFYITGEKVFITNSYYGRMICVVAKVEGEGDRKAVFVLDLPETDTEQFTLVKYGLHPLKHCYNHGLIFKDFEIPAENRVTDEETNGMLAAYHGLNFGRIAVLANAAGGLRQIVRSITPKSWGEYRRTMGESIQERELVQVRIARASALMVACDAIRDWASSKLDQGYRGELECTIAKVFGSWAQQEGAIEIGLLTHGGRALREGNPIGDNLFDFLAALIYEGENHMLLMKYFLEFFGAHGEEFMLPLGDSLADAKKGKLSGMLNLVRHGARYAGWVGKNLVRSTVAGESAPADMDARLAKHVKFALKQARVLALKGSYYMVKHQVKLQKRQNRMIDLSKLSLWTIVMLVTCAHAHRTGDETTIALADVMCQGLRQKIKPAHATDAYYADCAKAARRVIEGQLTELEGTLESPIIHPYVR